MTGEVVVVLTTDRTERVDPGTELQTDRGPLTVRLVAARTDPLAGPLRPDRRPRGRRVLARHRAPAAPIEDPDELWIHELVGSQVVSSDGIERGVVESVQANPASDLLVLDTGALVPLTFVAVIRPTASSTSTSPTVSSTSRSDARAHRRLHDLPGDDRGVRHPEPHREGARRAGLLDIRVTDVRTETTDPHRTVDDAPFGGGAGMVLMPEPIFAAVERVQPPRPLYLLGPGGRRLDQALAAELAAQRGLLAPVRSLRGRRRSGSATTSSTASCRSATTCWPGARWRRWPSSRP